MSVFAVCFRPSNDLYDALVEAGTTFAVEEVLGDQAHMYAIFGPLHEQFRAPTIILPGDRDKLVAMVLANKMAA